MTGMRDKGYVMRIDLRKEGMPKYAGAPEPMSGGARYITVTSFDNARIFKNRSEAMIYLAELELAKSWQIDNIELLEVATVTL